MTNTRTCELCGAKLVRRGDETWAKFDKRRFCNDHCSKQSRRVDSPKVYEPINCDCGKPATATLRFMQFNALGHPNWNTLRVCDGCKTDALLFDTGVSVA